MSEEYWATTLVLVRHGQARAGDGSYGSERPLSELGRLQAEAVANALAAVKTPTAVYTSPYPRAAETARPICRELGLKAAVDARLAEFDLGTGSLEAAQKRPDLVVWRPEHKGVETGETLEQFSVRVATFCDEIVERHARERVVVVAHSGTIHAALRWALGVAPGQPW